MAVGPCHSHGQKEADYMSSLFSVYNEPQVKQVTDYTGGSHCLISLRPVVYNQRVFFCGKVSLVAKHYISLPGSNNGFPEMLACCVSLSPVYVRVTEVAAFHCLLAVSFTVSLQHVV